MIRIVGTLCEDLGAFMIISRSVLLRMRNVLDKCCRENQNKRFMSNKGFFFLNLGSYEIMWEENGSAG